MCRSGVKGVAAVDGQPYGPDGHRRRCGLAEPCVTTTGPDGGYLCMVAPDSAEAEGVTLDLAAAAAGRWAGAWEGRPGVAAQTTAASRRCAPADGSPLITSADLVLDAGQRAVLVASGTASRDGVALGGDHQFTVEAFNGAGTRVGLLQRHRHIAPRHGCVLVPASAAGNLREGRVSSPMSRPRCSSGSRPVPGLGLGHQHGHVQPRVRGAHCTCIAAGTASTGAGSLAGPITIEVRARLCPGWRSAPAQTRRGRPPGAR